MSTETEVHPQTYQPHIPDFVEPEVLQLDNHTFGTFRTCHAKYYYRMVLQIVPAKRAPALGFGISMHAGRATYKSQILEGRSHEEAALIALASFGAAWKKEMPPESQSETMQDDRRSLRNGQRLLAGYLEKFKAPLLQPLYVEVPFAVSIGKVGRSEVVYTGIIDDVSKWANFNLVGEFKTTSFFPNANYFEQFKVSNALFGYVAAARELMSEEIHGAVAHAMWVNNEPKVQRSTNKPFGDYFQALTVIPAQSQLEEARANVLETVRDIKTCYERKYFPYNFGDACKQYRGCAYREICKVPKASRQAVMEQQYVKEVWDPLADQRAKREEE